MARVPCLERDQLDAEGLEIYDRIRQDRGAPRVALQFRALLQKPPSRRSFDFARVGVAL